MYAIFPQVVLECELTALIFSRKSLEKYLAVLDQGRCQIQASLDLPARVSIFSRCQGAVAILSTGFSL